MAATTSSGSRSASGRVSALSVAHARVAPATAAIPSAAPAVHAAPGTTTAAPPAAIATSASATRWPITSRYHSRASTTVNAASRLSSNAVTVAPARCTPQASNTGATAAPISAIATSRAPSARRRWAPAPAVGVAAPAR